MRPLILEMNAFGPFGEKQVLDFSELQEQNIFLITGPTGAGKTTVFDAVCFALYGDTSGESRQSDSLKSQFAEISEKSYVSFSFLVKGKIYNITRFPKQQRPGRNGEIREYNSSVLLTLPNGEVLTTAALVNEAVERVIGLSKDQFKKVVMLPQGEFRKLLEDKSDAKQEILRKIFSTEIYDDFTEQLKEKSKQAVLKQQKLMDDNKALLLSLRLDEDDDNSRAEEIYEQLGREIPDLEKVLLMLRDSLKNGKEKLAKFKDAADNCLKILSSVDVKYAGQINYKFDKLEEQLGIQAQLAGKSDEIEDKRRLLQKLMACAEFFELDEREQKLREEVEKYKGSIESGKQRLNELSEKLKISEIDCGRVAEYENKAEQLLKDGVLVSELIKKAEELQKIKQEALNLNEKIFKLQEKIVFLDECKAACEIKTRLCGAVQRLDKLNEILRVSESVNNEFKKFTSADKRCSNGYESFYRSAAAHLADGLAAGSPCPVCGAKEHPSLCRYDGGIVTKKELLELENARDEARKDLQHAEKKYSLSVSEYNAISEQKLCSESENSNLEVERLIEYNENILGNLKESAAEKEKLIASSEFYDEKIYELEFIASLRESSLRKEASYKGVRDDIAKRIEEAGEQGDNLDDLKSKLEETKRSHESLKAQIAEIRSKKSALELEKDRVSEAINKTVEFCSLKEAELKEAQLAGQRLKKEKDIDAATVESCKARIGLIEPLKTEINAYSEQSKVCEAVLESLRQELCGKKKFDIDKLKSEYERLKKEYDLANERYIELFSVLQQNEAIYNSVKKNTASAGEIELQARRTSYLASLAKGDNEQKISFERFVLTAYFQDVIGAANLRLSKLTNERYTLLRKLNKEKNGRGSGLELSVFDAYTGKTRDITTLSGGESFKAALSLALGLADTISRSAGGVDMDAIFIDEGFGSLDEQSLDSAVACLMELQIRGRLVGIISHVEALKERISAKLVVTPSKNGSVARFEVM